MDWVKAGGLDTCRLPELKYLDKYVIGQGCNASSDAAMPPVVAVSDNLCT
jgi:hypothetical protein